MLDQVPTSAFLCWSVPSRFNDDDGAGGGVDYGDDDDAKLLDLLTAQQSGNK